jgi:hypothetical protein
MLRKSREVIDMATNMYLSQTIAGVANAESTKVSIIGLPQNQNLVINGVYLQEVTATATNNFVLNVYHNLLQVASFDYRALLKVNGTAGLSTDGYIELNLPVNAGDSLTFSVVCGSSAANALVVVNYSLATAG